MKMFKYHKYFIYHIVILLNLNRTSEADNTNKTKWGKQDL